MTTETIDLSAIIRRAIKDPKEMTEEELERKRQHDDYVYHFMKEEQLQGRRID